MEYLSKRGLALVLEQIKLWLKTKVNKMEGYSLLADVKQAAYDAHLINCDNPHKTTKSQVGLGNCDNTSDIDKPVSTAQAVAIADAKQAGIDAQTTIDNHKVDYNNPHKVTKSQVGLSNVDNTSDINKPVSTAQQAVFDTKVDKTTRVNGHPLYGDIEVNKSDVGLSEVQNIAPLDMPVSNRTAAELSKKADKATCINGHKLDKDIVISKGDVGLSNVDNTSDVNKPVSIYQQQALDLKADKSITINGHSLANNVTVTKSDVGLGNVTNDAQVKRSEMGAANGVATLDSNGILNISQLPSHKTINGESIIGSGNINTIQDLSGYVTSDTLSSTLNNYVTNNSLSSSLSNYYTKSEVSNIVNNVSVDLSNYYTKSQVNDLIASSGGSSVDLSNYYNKTEINNLFDNYYNKADVDKKITDTVTGGTVDLSNYYNKTEINNIITSLIGTNSDSSFRQHVTKTIPVAVGKNISTTHKTQTISFTSVVWENRFVDGDGKSHWNGIGIRIYPNLKGYELPRGYLYYALIYCEKDRLLFGTKIPLTEDPKTTSSPGDDADLYPDNYSSYSKADGVISTSLFPMCNSRACIGNWFSYNANNQSRYVDMISKIMFFAETEAEVLAGRGSGITTSDVETGDMTITDDNNTVSGTTSAFSKDTYIGVDVILYLIVNGSAVLGITKYSKGSGFSSTHDIQMTDGVISLYGSVIPNGGTISIKNLCAKFNSISDKELYFDITLTYENNAATIKVISDSINTSDWYAKVKISGPYAGQLSSSASGYTPAT